MPELADLFTDAPGLKFRVATVVSVAAGKAVISFGGDNVSGVAFLSHLAPKPGDVVVVAFSGRQNLIIGSPSTGTAGYQTMTMASGYYTPDWSFAASYRIIGDRVFLAGAIAKTSGDFAVSAAGHQVATIPAEARPPTGLVANMPAASSAVSGTSFLMRLEVQSTGIVLARVPYAGANWIGLDGLSYRLR